MGVVVGGEKRTGRNIQNTALWMDALLASWEIAGVAYYCYYYLFFMDAIHIMDTDI